MTSIATPTTGPSSSSAACRCWRSISLCPQPRLEGHHRRRSRCATRCSSWRSRRSSRPTSPTAFGCEADARVRHRLPDRVGALGRQPLRLPGDLHLLRGARRAPAPRAVLGHPRRDRPARRLHRRRRGAARQVPLDDLRLRRLPGLHRRQAPVRRATSEIDPSSEPGAPALRSASCRVTPRLPRHSTSSCASNGRCIATPLFLVLLRRRDHRRRLRGRLDPGDLRGHPRPVHRLHVEHLRDPRPALALLRARRRDGQVPLPEVRPRRSSCRSSA